MKIVSGGQTGADRAALDFALERGIPIGGWVPKGRLAEDGAIPERYAALRRFDAMATIRFTDLLAGVFTGTNPIHRLLRGAALGALDACAPAKRFFARRMIFGSSAMP